MTDPIVIVGAGMAGLGAALALQRTGQRVLLLERDAPPPAGGPEEAFRAWQRRGAPQLRHSHGFVGFMRNLLRDRYPALHAELLAAGAREYGFVDALPPPMQRGYRPRSDDQRMLALLCRRATLELVLHRHVAALPGVELRSGARVRELLLEPAAGTHALPRVRGVAVQLPDQPVQQLAASALIDASGAGSRLVARLRARGVPVREESADTEIVYFTRFYRLRPGASEPDGRIHARVGDLGYLKFGVFPADHGTFSVTLVAPAFAAELQRLRERDAFERACRAIPGVALWLAPELSVAETDVSTMHGGRSHYREFVAGGRPSVLGYFAVGDAAVRTNPLYARGCSLCLLQTELLAESLAASPDPAAQAQRFAALNRRDAYPLFKLAARQDRLLARVARHLLEPRAPLPLRDRLLRSFIEDGVARASASDLRVRRAFRREFHMLAPPGSAARKLGVMARAASFWLGSLAGLHARGAPLGPSLQELRASLNGAEPRRVQRAQELAR